MSLQPFDRTKVEEIKITPEILADAKSRDPGVAFNDKSFEEGRGTLVGCLGENLFGIWRTDWKFQSTYDYDFIKNGKTVDVKTKYQSPQCIPIRYIDEWMASVCIDSVHQKVDYYVFCRVCKVKVGSIFEYPFGWMVGVISKEEYFQKARFYKAGEKEGGNGYAVRRDCYSLPFKQLYRLEKRILIPS